MSDKLIINAALTGVVPTKRDNPNLPITPSEIRDSAKCAQESGASMLHLHARDSQGLATHQKEYYREIIRLVRESCPDIIITVSTSGRRAKDIRKRSEVLELSGSDKPDMASLTLGSLNFIHETSVTTPDDIHYLLKKMYDADIRPELEIFDMGMAHYSKFLINKNRLSKPIYANLLLGSLGTIAATHRNLVHLVDELPEETIWAATGVGQFAFDVQCLSIAMGGHVRVGLEDSLYMDKANNILATNEKLISRVRKIAEAMGRDCASPRETRRMLGL